MLAILWRAAFVAEIVDMARIMIIPSLFYHGVILLVNHQIFIVHMFVVYQYRVSAI